MNIKNGFYGWAWALILVLNSSNTIAKTSLGEVGQLHFSITITNKTCELEKAALEVDMGKVALPKSASIGNVLSQRDFALELKDCDGLSKASVTMDSLPDSDDNSLFALDAGGATGIALKIEDDKGTQQVPKASGGTAIDWPITGASATLNYHASYVIVNNKPTSGKADALVNFSITYE